VSSDGTVFYVGTEGTVFYDGIDGTVGFDGGTQHPKQSAPMQLVQSILSHVQQSPHSSATQVWQSTASHVGSGGINDV